MSKTAEEVAALGPDRIASYGYAHLPQLKRNQRLIDETALPGPVERFAQAEAMGDVFQARGYAAVGLDHYARPGDPLAMAAAAGQLHRNFQGYTDDASTTLLGFGASAVSRFPQGYLQAIAEPTAYAYAVRRGHLPTARGYLLTAEDRQRGAIIERLMCDFAVDLNLFGIPERRFGAEIEALAPLVNDGIATVENGVVAVSPEARRFVRLVAAAFDTHRQNPTARFSLAV